MLQLTSIKNAAFRAAVKPREQDFTDSQLDFSKHIPNYVLKGRKMRSTSTGDNPLALPSQRIIKLREYKSKHNSLWQVEEYMARDSPTNRTGQLNSVSNESTQLKHAAKLTSANLPNKMNEYLNELVMGYGSTTRPSQKSRRHDHRTGSSQSIRDAIHKKKQQSNCSPFFRAMRRAVNRTYFRRTQLSENRTMPLIELSYIQKMKESNDMVKRATRLPPRETRPIDLQLVEKNSSPNKCYRKKVRSREQGIRNSSLTEDF